LRIDSNLVETITRKESLDVLGIRNSRERFEAMLGLLVGKVDLLSRKDYPLDYVASESAAADGQLQRQARPPSGTRKKS
jgi:hypothetical protein